MLRFFRQIRQRLLTENRFRKYILYAVGLYGAKHGVFLDYFVELDSLSGDLMRRLEELE